MPLKVNVGLSKKIGQPDYGSLGASCHVEFEADSNLLHQDLETFHRNVKNAFVACKQAVEDELHREGQAAAASSGLRQRSNGNTHGARHRSGPGRRRDNTRRATASQVRALEAIASRQHLDLTNVLRERWAIDNLSELSITEASSLIDELNTTKANGAH